MNNFQFSKNIRVYHNCTKKSSPLAFRQPLPHLRGAEVYGHPWGVSELVIFEFEQSNFAHRNLFPPCRFDRCGKYESQAVLVY